MKLILSLISLGLIPSLSQAHFQTLLPDQAVITEKSSKMVTLQAQFTHPMEQGPLMNMAMPQQFGVIVNGQSHNLLPTLQSHQQDGNTWFSATYQVKSPADYVFFLEPTPYWEALEGKMIVHYTKVVVDAFTAETGWETMVNFPIEIQPLVRPYGLWTGNLFRGIVIFQGKPLPFATIEVEYFNENHHITIPADPFITQKIKADANGNFAYAMPIAGWWGFAALTTGDELVKNPLDELVPVELGGLIWIQVIDME